MLGSDEPGDPSHEPAQQDEHAIAHVREALSQHRALCDHGRDIMLFIHPHSGRILEANQAAVTAYDYDRERLCSMTIVDLRAPARRQEIPRQLAQADAQGLLLETEHMRRDGTVFPVEISARGAEVAGQRLVLSVIRDITERKRAEHALREADRHKEEFLAILAHEMRNPLAPIRSAVQLLRRRGGLPAEATRLHEVIDRQSVHMVRLLDDLLDISRISRGKLLLRRERLELGALVRSACEDYRGPLEAERVGLEVALPALPLWVEGDCTRLSQAIGNLLHNAGKFTPPGGTVWVGLEQVAGPGGPQAQVVVRDNGTGIAPARLQRIFEPFTQGEGHVEGQGGLGLGLALVRGLIELHGGATAVASAGVGEGAAFTLRLPLCSWGGASAEPAGESAPMPVSAISPVPGARRVLLIEDHPDIAETLQELLVDMGYEVRVAGTGQAGVTAALAQPPDVVLCDIGLPGGMDGYQVARSLRREPAIAGTLLVALTGFGQESDRRRAKEAGFDRHLTKPIEIELLERVLCESR